MSINRVESHAVVDPDGGNEDVQPRNGESSIANAPGQHDGAFPVIFAGGPQGITEK